MITAFFLQSFFFGLLDQRKSVKRFSGRSVSLNNVQFGCRGHSSRPASCVTVEFADTVYFTKVDMFDLPCKSNSICKGSAFARYIRLATDAICFSCGKTCCSHQIRYSVLGTHSFLFLYSLRKGATSRLSSQHTQLSHPSTV